MSASPSSAPLATFHRGGIAVSRVVIAMALGLILLIGYFVLTTPSLSDEPGLRLPIFLYLSVLPAMFALGGIMGIRMRLRIFDAGVEGRGMFVPARFVRFTAVVDLKWAVRQGRIGRTSTLWFVNARVRGTDASTGFIIPEPEDATTLVWARDRMCDAIVQRGLEALWRGEAFEWAGVSMWLDGLRQRNGTVLPYTTPFRERTDGQRYTLAIAGPGDGETVFTTKMAALNFYPGWMLFLRLASKVERP